MAIRTVKDIDPRNKRILVRVDFNVPIKEGRIMDDTRMLAALPTLRYLLDRGASLVVMSHLGRPGGKVKPELSLFLLKEHLAEITKSQVTMAPDVIGEEVETLSKRLKPNEILLLENTRFRRGEMDNSEEFCAELSKLGDIYINDAFGAAHRAHASTEGIAKLLPSAAGLLMEKECKFLDKILYSPRAPFVAIIGGAKVSSKIAVLESLSANAFIIAGGMAYTFLKAQGYRVGNSLVEVEYLDIAQSFLADSKKRGVKVLLPFDHVVGNEFSMEVEAENVDDVNVPEGKIAMDIGPKTLFAIDELIADAKTVVWNGPMGVFEFEAFSKGTLEVARMIAKCEGTTVVGGGDSVAAVNKFNLADSIDHVSTGGGASLEYLEGKMLPGVSVLKD